MIPAFHIPSLHIFGPLQIHPFGALVATGIGLGILVTRKRAKDWHLSEDQVTSAIFWLLIPAFLGAHLFEVLFYKPQMLDRYGLLALLRFWDGISSFGGFIGGALGLLWFRATQARGELLKYTDSLMHGMVVGWIFGRLGCTIVMDHPGHLTDSPLAFAHATGPRHNLGFYELLWTMFALLPATLILHRLQRRGHGIAARPGMVTAVVSLLYAPVRFILDFFRAEDLPSSDLRYFGLTFAHYASLALLVFAILLLRRLRREALFQEEARGGSNHPGGSPGRPGLAADRRSLRDQNQRNQKKKGRATA